MPDISLKTPQEVALMAEGGKKLSQILQKTLKKVKPGLSTKEIDRLIDQGIAKSKGEAAFKKVTGYQWASCVGLNQEVVHSIPKEDKIIKKGDLLKIDLGLFWQGFNTDMAWTIEVESKEHQEFLAAGKLALAEAIKVARPGNRVGHISWTIQEIIKDAGYCPVRILTGHGIGRQLHEEPLVPGILKGDIRETPELVAGMTLAIEIIYGLGSGEVVLGEDSWTILTKDGKMSGLFEKTIAIGKDKPLVLTPFKFTKSAVRGDL